MSPIRVLVADDHLLFWEEICRACKAAGLEVVSEASDGQAAVELAKHVRPDVILMDVRMPVMDGIQATRLIVQENPAVRVIAMTVHADGPTARAVLEAGAVRCLPKDGPEESILEAVTSVHSG